jgi:hypothetical protein
VERVGREREVIAVVVAVAAGVRGAAAAGDGSIHLRAMVVTVRIGRIA